VYHLESTPGQGLVYENLEQNSYRKDENNSKQIEAPFEHGNRSQSSEQFGILTKQDTFSGVSCFVLLSIITAISYLSQV